MDVTPDTRPSRPKIIAMVNRHIFDNYGKGLSEAKISRVLDALEAAGLRLVAEENSDAL